MQSIMEERTINILLTTFPGIGLPRTLNVQVPSTSTIGDVERIISNRLPANATNLVLTTTDNKLLKSHREELVTSLLEDEHHGMLPLRLSAALCGGKGGFGSQLRAAGGRISSRKKRAQGDQNASSRTLDGRRIRTVNEAKALAEYLAIKPQMEQHEREERRKRLEEIVRSTEARKAEVLAGKAGKSAGRLDGEWLEGKEEAGEKAREAVLAALRRGDVKEVFGEDPRESDSSDSGSEDDGSDSEEAEVAEEAKKIAVPSKPASAQAAPMKFFGWDEDELSDSDEDEDEEVDEAEKNDIREDEEITEATVPPGEKAADEEQTQTRSTTRGKGKGKTKR